MSTLTVTINTKIHTPMKMADGQLSCVCGWKPGAWGRTTFGDHVGRIVDDKIETPWGTNQ